MASGLTHSSTLPRLNTRLTERRVAAYCVYCRCLNTSNWTGSVGAKLGGLLYIDLCDESKFEQAIAQLTEEIKEKRATTQHV